MFNVSFTEKYIYKMAMYLSTLIVPALPVIAQTREVFYAGTYSERGSKGIYVYRFDRSQGKLTEIQTVTEGKSPNFLVVHPNKKYLYAVYNEGKQKVDKQGSVAAFKIDQATGFLTMINESPSQGSGPAHVSADPKGRFLYVSNYGEGNFSVYRVNPDGGIGAVTDVIKHTGSGGNPQRQSAPHVHSVIPSRDGKFIYVSDLGIDKVMIYEVDDKTGKVSPGKSPYGANASGSGPRHFTIHPNGKFGFSAEELTSTVASFKIDQLTGALTPIERVSMLPDEFKEKSSAADIHLSPDGKFLYASNRGHESLVIYAVNASTGKLTFVAHENTRGRHPRNFCIDSRGQFVFVANRDTDNITIFSRDARSGKLKYTGTETQTPAVVCIEQLMIQKE